MSYIPGFSDNLGQESDPHSIGINFDEEEEGFLTGAPSMATEIADAALQKKLFGTETPFLISDTLTRIQTGPALGDKAAIADVAGAVMNAPWSPLPGGFRSRPFSTVAAAAGALTLDILSKDVPDATATESQIPAYAIPFLDIHLGGTNLSAVPNSVYTFEITYYTPGHTRVTRSYVIQPEGVALSFIFLPFEEEGGRAAYGVASFGPYPATHTLTGEQKHHLRVKVDSVAKGSKLTVTIPGRDHPATKKFIGALIQ